MAHIELESISLSYPVLGRKSRSVVAAAKSLGTGGIIRRSGRHSTVTALDDVTFSARHGDRIGILGRNGAGKTTLLKVAAGILKPDQGRIRRMGKTMTVISPAVGLDQRLTGNENIEQVALLYGLSRREIEGIRPDIASFTELGEFLDLPVETYSAGMKTRLAFGVATAFHPEILVVDESLGSGDAQFVTKARERMHTMMDRASLLLLASHSIRTIKTMCNRAILMKQGRILTQGSVDEVVQIYEESQAQRNNAASDQRAG